MVSAQDEYTGVQLPVLVPPKFGPIERRRKRRNTRLLIVVALPVVAGSSVGMRQVVSSETSII